MARPPPRRRVNGTRTPFMPLTPDSILVHLLRTQDRHSREIVRLTTQMSMLQRSVFPWRTLMPGLSGVILLVLLVLVATGRITLAEAMALLGRV